MQLTCAAYLHYDTIDLEIYLLGKGSIHKCIF